MRFKDSGFLRLRNIQITFEREADLHSTDFQSVHLGIVK